MRKEAWRDMRIDTTVFRDSNWWSWVALIALLAIRATTGRTEPILVAVAVCSTVAGIDLGLRNGNLRAMSVQIRIGYVLMLILGLLPMTGWLHAMQLVGTTVRVLCGYCLLERGLRMLPWNLGGEALTLSRAWAILAACPGAGGIVQFGAEESPCSIGSTCDRFGAHVLN